MKNANNSTEEMNGNVKKKSKKKKELTVRSGNLVSEVNNDKGGGEKTKFPY